MSTVKEIMEDALRIATEEGKKIISVAMLEEDIIATEELLTDAIYELEKEGLARIKNDEAILTKRGVKELSEKILHIKDIS